MVYPTWGQVKPYFGYRNDGMVNPMPMVKRGRDEQKEYAALLARLILARREAGLTQTEVARRLGKPRSYVSKCEQGERRVDVIELLTFARIYHKTLSFFCE